MITPESEEQDFTEEENLTASVRDVTLARHVVRGEHIQVGKFIHFWEPDRVTLFSVTAATDDEALQLESFKEGLAPDLRAVVEKHAPVFEPPDREPPEREVKHHIRLVQDAVPLKRRPYPLGEK